jgi:hypothetical protein
LVEDQVRVAVCPAGMLDGETLRVTIGEGALEEPPPPHAVSNNNPMAPIAGKM